jgi:hypothetical protein
MVLWGFCVRHASPIHHHRTAFACCSRSNQGPFRGPFDSRRISWDADQRPRRVRHCRQRRGGVLVLGGAGALGDDPQGAQVGRASLTAQHIQTDRAAINRLRGVAGCRHLRRTKTGWRARIDDPQRSVGRRRQTGAASKRAQPWQGCSPPRDH